MRTLIPFLLIIFAASRSEAQIVRSQQFQLSGKTVNKISNDSSLIQGSQASLVTEWAVKNYFDNRLQSVTIRTGNSFPVSSQSEMLALTAIVGDVAIRSDVNKSFILGALPASTLGNWRELLSPGQLLSFAGRTGVIVPQAGDYNYSQISGTPDPVVLLPGNGISVNQTGNTFTVTGTQEPVISASNAVRNYWTGYKTYAVLNTDSIAEGSQKFFTDARVLAALQKASNTRAGIVKPGRGLAVDSLTGELSTKAALLTPKSVPFVANDGELTEDNTGLSWDGNNLDVGKSGFYNTTGLRLNGGRATMAASGNGMIFGTGDRGALTPMDLSKVITIYNNRTDYGTFRMGSASDSTMYFSSNSTFYPTNNLGRSLGTATNRWNNVYAKYGRYDSLFIGGVYFDPANGGSSYTLPPASSGVLGGVRIGTGLTVDGSGVVSNPFNKSAADTYYEPVFGKNSAFNKSFGTGAGQVAEGSDSRIVNGQTAFGWGNHAAAGYISTSVANATYATISNLALKANDNEVVKLSGNQTITGEKSFTNTTTLFGTGSNAMVGINYLGTPVVNMYLHSATGNAGFGFNALFNPDSSKFKVLTSGWANRGAVLGLSPTTGLVYSSITAPNGLSEPVVKTDLFKVDYTTGQVSVYTVPNAMGNFITRNSTTGGLTERTAAQVKSDLALNNVNNTSDANKPVSTATQTALNLKQDAATAFKKTQADTLYTSVKDTTKIYASGKLEVYQDSILRLKPTAFDTLQSSTDTMYLPSNYIKFGVNSYFRKSTGAWGIGGIPSTTARGVRVYTADGSIGIGEYFGESGNTVMVYNTGGGIGNMGIEANLITLNAILSIGPGHALNMPLVGDSSSFILSEDGGEISLKLGDNNRNINLLPTGQTRIRSIAPNITDAVSGVQTVNVDITQSNFVVSSVTDSIHLAIPTGTPLAGQKLIYQLYNGSASPQSVSFDAIFRFAIGDTAPTFIAPSNTLYIEFSWNLLSGKYDAAILKTF